MSKLREIMVISRLKHNCSNPAWDGEIAAFDKQVRTIAEHRRLVMARSEAGQWKLFGEGSREVELALGLMVYE